MPGTLRRAGIAQCMGAAASCDPEQAPDASGSSGIAVLEPGEPVMEALEARTLDFGDG